MWAFLAVLLIACGQEPALPDDVPGLKAAAEAALKEVLAARTRRDPKAAARESERAEKAAAKAKDAGVSALAKEAARQAKLAAEDREILDRTTGLKAKAYTAAREVALTQGMKGLALAAEQRAKGGEPAPGVKESSDLGRALAEGLGGRRPLEDGGADWPGIAADLRGFAEKRPGSVSLYLAFACLVTGREGLGLIEIQSLDPATLSTPDQVFSYHLVRGLLLRLNGLPESGDEAFAALAAAGAPEVAEAWGTEIQGTLHLILAVFAFQDKDYTRADLEIARSIKIWPNHPAAVYLTGERLAATGEREKAAASLEASMAGTKEEWIAKRIAERARQVRDGTGPAEPLIHDPAFLRDLLLRQLWEAAKASPKARPLKALVDAAAPFLDRWIPGGK
jgi:hypothetical protein